MIEAKKLAYADMARYVGDPRFGPVPVPEMLSKDLAKKRAGLIDMEKASCRCCRRILSATLAAHGNEPSTCRRLTRKHHRIADPEHYSGYGTGFVRSGRGLLFPQSRRGLRDGTGQAQLACRT